MSNRQPHGSRGTGDSQMLPDLEMALDDCLDQVLIDHLPLRVCLDKYPENADDLAPLLETAELLDNLPDIQPSQHFKRRTRRLLLGIRESPASTVLGKGHRRHINALLKLVVGLGIAFVILGTSWVSMLASVESLPGTPLYAAKRRVESVQLVFAQDSASRASVHMMLAERRLAEVERLALEGRTELAEEALAEYGSNISSVLRDLESVQKESGSQSIKDFREQLARRHQELRQQEAKAQGAAKQPLRHALTLTAGIIEKATRLVDVTTGGSSH